MLSAIKSDQTSIKKRVVKCIYWALVQTEYHVQLGKDVIYQLETQLENLFSSNEYNSKERLTAKDAHKKLQSMKEKMFKDENTA